MTDQARPLAVVTGASEGLGRELAALYARDGFDVALVARRAGLLHAVADELQRAHGVRCLVLPADLASTGAVASVLAALEPHRHQVRALVNNAGFGNVGWFHDIPAERHRALLEVNVAALTQLTHGVLPWLLAGGRGHVMNVASVAAFQPGPVMATYYASKAYVLSLSVALHNECRGTGVTVTCVCPGPTRTGFQRAAGVSASSPSGGTPFMDVRVVAALAYRGMRAGRPIVVTGLRNRIAAFLGRHSPRAWTAAVVRRIQLSRLRASERASQAGRS